MTRARGPRRSVRAGWVAVLVASGLTVAAVTPVAAAPNEYAPSIGTVTAATTGALGTGVNFNVKTSVPCPSSDTVVNAYIDDPTLGWTKGQVLAISANSTDLGTLTTTGMPLSDNLANLASTAGKKLVDGTYQFSLTCLPSVFGSADAQMDGTFTVTGMVVSFAVPGVASTTTTLTVSPASPAPAGSTATLSATLTPSSAPGTVQFADTVGGITTDLGSPVTVAAGVAAFAATALAAGPHSFTAVFTPSSASFSGSTSLALPYTVLGANQQTTRSTLTVSPASGAGVGATVTLTSTVTPAGAAGTVTFTDLTSGAVLASGVAVSDGTATTSLSSLLAGRYSLRAAFTPTDATAYAGSVSPPVAYTITGPGSTALGTLTVKPAQGLATDTLTLSTQHPCPAGADTVTVSLSGPGGWAGGINIPVTTTVSSTLPFDIVSSSIAQAAATAGLTIQPGAYTFRATCTQVFGATVYGYFSGDIWFYDTTHWINQDPAKVGVPTVTTLTVSPPDRADLGAAVTFTAVVQPASATGSVTFQSTDTGSTTVFGSATLTDGTAALTTTKLAFGLYYAVAVFKPSAPSAGAAKDDTSTSPETVYVSALPIPPLPPRSAVLTGTARVGSTLGCVGEFSNATTITYTWLRDGRTIDGATSAGYAVGTADRGHALSCSISATNTGGTTSRTSGPVVVTR